MAFNLVQSITCDTRTLRERLALREVLEAELIRRMTGSHTPEQLAGLAELVTRMEECAARGVLDAAVDRAFHDALYEPLGNQVVTLILHAFCDVQARVESQLPPPACIATTHVMNARWHRDIYLALQQGDASAAVAAMREQFTGVRRRLALDPAP